MIKKLLLNNYRVYDSLDMDFDNLQIIKGRNGIGKTSIVEAIGFALFGASLHRGKAGSWIKEGHKDGSVELYIDDYIITRSNSKAIVTDLLGNVIARNNIGITEWVEKEYGLTADLYKTSFYIGQKDIGAFAALGPLERTKRVEKLLRIDRLDEIKNSAKEKARAEQIALNIYESKLENSYFNAEILEQANEDINKAVANIKLFEPMYEEALIKGGAYKQEIIRWQEKQNLLKKYTGEVPNLEKLEIDYKAMLERNSTVVNHNNLVNEKAIIVKNLKGILVLEEYFKYSISQIMNHEKAHTLYKKLKNEADRLNCFPIAHDIAAMVDEVSKQQHLYDVNIDIPKYCPTCEQAWPIKPTIDIVNIRNKLKTMKEELEQAKKEQRTFEIKQQLVLPEWTKEMVEEAYIALDNKVAYTRLKELKGYDELKEIEGFHTDMKAAREQKVVADRLRELEDVTEPIKIDPVPIKVNLDEAHNLLKEAEQQVQKQKNYQEIEIEFKQLQKDTYDKLEKLKEFVKFIDRYRKAFGNNVIPLIETNVSKIVSYLTEGKYSDIKINPDYGIDNFEFYSGSEQDSINFALRLAIAQVSKLGSFNTMLLDEIAASFDTEKEALLMDILKQQSNQLIYITHGDF